jgi:hypothetical protein
MSLLVVMALHIPSHSCFALDAAILTEYTHKVASKICKGNTDWMRCYNLDPLSCESQSEAIIGTCMKEHVFTRTQPVQTEADVRIVSDQVFSCIRTTFSHKFDARKKDSPECRGLE